MPAIFTKLEMVAAFSISVDGLHFTLSFYSSKFEECHIPLESSLNELFIIEPIYITKGVACYEK